MIASRLLFITSTRIGDAVLGSGLLDHLVRQTPGVAVTVAGGAAVAPLFDGVPGLDRFIPMVKQPFAGHWRHLWAQTVGRRWDMVVDLRGSAVGWFLWRGRLVRWSRAAAGEGHQVERLGRLLGLTPPPAPRLFPSVRQREDAARFLKTDGPILAMAPAAAGTHKQWRPEWFADLAHWMTGPQGILPGATLLLLGTPAEREIMGPMFSGIAGLPFIDGFGCGDLGMVGQLLTRCNLFVGNDSGLMHMAAAAGIPTFGIFGMTPPHRYRPWGEKTGFTYTPIDAEDAMRRHYAEGLWPMDLVTPDQVRQDLAALWQRVAG